MTEQELYHHGILGQKWGVRRYQNKDGSLTPLGRKRLDTPDNDNNTKKQAAGASTYKKSDVSKLSNQEIQDRINRLNLERQYKQLLPEERGKGKIFVQDMLNPALKDAGKKLTKTVVNSIADPFNKVVEQKLGGNVKNLLGLKADDKSSSSYKLEDISKLSTSELQERNKRLTAEKVYAEHLNKRKQSTPPSQSETTDKSAPDNDNHSEPKVAEKPKTTQNSKDTPSTKPEFKEKLTESKQPEKLSKAQDNISSPMMKADKQADTSSSWTPSRYDDAMSTWTKQQDIYNQRVKNLEKARNAKAEKKAEQLVNESMDRKASEFVASRTEEWAEWEKLKD